MTILENVAGICLATSDTGIVVGSLMSKSSKENVFIVQASTMTFPADLVFSDPLISPILLLENLVFKECSMSVRA